jgi:hypothetical protein
MDRETRNWIQRATQDARALLEREYAEQLAGTFDLRLDGTIAAEPGGHLDAGQRLVRAKLVTAVEHLRAAGHGKNAVAAYLRETAFTTLNRFVALKMLEARGLVQECLSRGEESSGFKEFVGLAPGLVQLPDHGYRLYIESLFDEMGREVRVLFDRRDPANLLWPRRQPLLELLAILNAAELASVWGEDETIGWVYQYFNSDEERRQMRAESQAPRNSREMAVRNQFFTPRYVVQFLTDNTLGRIWYEMRRGETRLRDLDYLARRPNEVFLAEGEEPPVASDGDDDDLSQEELLRRSVYVTFRAKKDPRDIRVLDPACGSGHFLLYAFDLLLVIYEEAWADEGAVPKSEITGKTLREDYADLATLRAAVPGLILRHNLHGIDIDARCAQIAALALWMRAQRAFKDLGFAREARPPIQKTNIVVAEPMPGEPELRREFIATLDHKLGQLVKRVFDRMELAGEAGSLLRIEDDIREAIREIHGDYGRLFRASDDERWRQAEDDVLRALRAYAERAANGRSFQRRLFADDAARGFAFIDASRIRFDAIVMNPPFGDPTPALVAQCRQKYKDSLAELLCALLERARAWLVAGGLIGTVGPSQTGMKPSVVDWRIRWLKEMQWECCADLGGHVLDGATIRVAATCIGYRAPTRRSAFFRLVSEGHNKASALLRTVRALADGQSSRTTFAAWQLDFLQLPNAPLAYWFSGQQIAALSLLPTLEPAFGIVRVGLQTSSDEEFVRCLWEIPQGTLAVDEAQTYSGKGWVPLAKGGEYAPYAGDLHFAVEWTCGGRRMRAFEEGRKKLGLASRGNSALRDCAHYFKPGITYTHRTNKTIAPRLLPAGCVFGVKGPSVLDSPSLLVTLGVMSSRVFKVLVGMGTGRAQAEGGAGANSYDVGLVRSIPFPLLSEAGTSSLLAATRDAVRARIRHLANDETSPWFDGAKHDFYAQRSLLVSADRLLSEQEDIALDLWRAEKQLNEVTNAAYGLGPLFDEIVEDELGPPSWSLAEDLMSAYPVEVVRVYEQVLGKEVRTVATEEGVPVVVSSLLELAAHAARLAPPQVAACRRITNVVPTSVLVGTAAECVSHLIGVAFGRFDYSDHTINLGPDLVRSLTDKLRINANRTVRPGAPSILVDDPGYSADVVATLLEAASLGTDTDAFRRELEEVGRLGDLRTWVGRQFFEFHRKKYSSGPRKAPIYWQFATPSARYSVWTYYHRFTRDTLYRILNDCVTPKLRHEERKLMSLTQGAGPTPSANQRKEIDAQEKFVTELRAFREEVARVAPLWKPDLNDGVIINFSPLWRLVPQNRSWQKECKAVWDKLVAGEYEWAHLAMHLWPERVVPKCAKDHSLAIAHGLEEVFWEEDAESKWKPKKVAKEVVDRLIEERTSAAVRAALDDLLCAPAPTATVGGRRGAGRRRSAANGSRPVASRPRTNASPAGTHADDATITAVKEAIAAVKGGVSRAEVMEATGISSNDWNAAINALLAQGAVVKTGTARGTRYQLAVEEETA